MKNIFAKAVIGFKCVIQDDGRVTGSFLARFIQLKYRKMAAAVEVSCSEPHFDSSVFFFQIYQLRHICSGPNNYEWLTVF